MRLQLPKIVINKNNAMLRGTDFQSCSPLSVHGPSSKCIYYNAVSLETSMPIELQRPLEPAAYGRRTRTFEFVLRAERFSGQAKCFCYEKFCFSHLKVRKVRKDKKSMSKTVTHKNRARIN